MYTVTEADIDAIYAPSFDFNTPLDRQIFVENRERLLAAARAAFGTEGVLFLAAAPEACRYDTDRDLKFRQESNFFWMTGAEEAAGAGAVLDLATGTFTFATPRLPIEFAIWIGVIPTLEAIRAETGADACIYVDELASLLTPAPKIFTTKFSLEQNIVDLSGISGTVDAAPAHLAWTLQELRKIKTRREVLAMTAACRQNSEAQVQAWKSTRAGQREYEVAARFTYECAIRNSQHPSFEAIPACDFSATMLHYIALQRVARAGNTFLLDAGSEWHCYASDITRVFPVGGKFTEDQKSMYNVVLAAADACIAMSKAGIEWREVHREMLLVLARGLINLGVIVNCTPEEAFDRHVICLMCPHGLGHPLGLDTHDVGGHLPGYAKPADPNFRNLRCSRELQAGMVMTVEPGLYNVGALVKPLRDGTDAENRGQYINWEQFDRYFTAAPGIRIEDDILITSESCIMLTRCPRKVEDVEKAMN